MFENFQDAFDQTYAKMMKQGRKSITADGCAYRSEAGACAVGVWIPDYIYDCEMEGKSAAALMAVSPAVFHRINVKGIHEKAVLDFWGSVQSAHDNADRDNFVRDFDENMCLIAAKHGLTMPEIPDA